MTVQAPETFRFHVPLWLAQKKGITCNLQLEEVVSNREKSVVVKAKPVYVAAENCHVCGRDVDDPRSRMIGIGPICAKRIGFPYPSSKENAEEYIARVERTVGDVTWEVMLPKSQSPELAQYLKDNVAKPAIEADIRVQGGVITLKFTKGFNMQLVDDLKNSIDYRYRSYDRKTYTWTIAQKASEALVGYLRENGIQIPQELLDIAPEDGATITDASPSYSVTLDGDGFIVKFIYDAEIKDAVKAIPGSRFNGDYQNPFWTVPALPSSVIGLIDLIDNGGFVSLNGARERLAELGEETLNMRQASEAVDTDVDIDIEGLYPFQKAGAAYALQAKRVIIADQMGLGKTVQALATISAADAFPAVIIPPASLKLNWKKEVEKWIPNRSVEVLNGKGDVNYDADILVINYDILATGWQGNTELKEVKREIKACKDLNEDIPENLKRRKAALQREVNESKKKKRIELSEHVRRILGKNPQALVLDEAHYIKSNTAQRSQAVRELARGIEYKIFLTGTPMLSRPAELIFPLTVLGRLQEMGGFKKFTERYCDAYHTRWGLDITGASNLQELNERMRSSFYVRRTTDQVVGELPEKTYAPQYVEISNREKYQQAEDEFVEYVQTKALEDPEFLERIKDLPEDEQELQRIIQQSEAAQKVSVAEVLMKINELKRLTGFGKVEATIEWIRNFLESSDEKLIVFAHHREIVERIASEFDAPTIMGSQSNDSIEAGKEAFQNDPNTRLIVLNLKAGGVGHTLTAAHHVAFVEYPWNPGDMDQAIQRAWARLNDMHGVTVWNLFASETMDETMAGILDSKRRVVEQATDGKDVSSIFSLVEALMNRVAA